MISSVQAGVAGEERLEVALFGGLQRFDRLRPQIGDLAQWHRRRGDSGSEPLQPLSQLAHLVDVLARWSGDERSRPRTGLDESVTFET